VKNMWWPYTIEEKVEEFNIVLDHSAFSCTELLTFFLRGKRCTLAFKMHLRLSGFISLILEIIPESKRVPNWG
jgi:hypothetical protein